MTIELAAVLLMLVSAVLGGMLAAALLATAPPRPPRRRRRFALWDRTVVLLALAIAAVVVLAPAIAFAGTGGEVGGTGSSLTDVVGAASAAAVAALLTWVGKHVVALMRQSKAGRAAETAIHDLHLDSMIADLAIAFATQQAKRLAELGQREVSDSQMLGNALDFAKAHGYSGDDLRRIEKTIEARLTMTRAQRKLGAAVDALEADMPSIKDQISKFPKGTAATASGELPK